jgi:glycosyltransferase involved in cell wall biosynthesis
MVDPLDAEALAGAMGAVLADDALRAQLSRQGLERAATFSWEATARTVLGVYRSIAQP